MTNRWEDKVKVSLDDIFKDTKSDDKEVETTYSDMSSEEINDIYEIVHDEAYLEDLDKYYTTGEQMDLAGKGIHLTIAKKYHLETEKKPIYRKRVTNKFRDWLEANYPDLVKLLSNDGKVKEAEIKDLEASEIIEEKILTTYEHALTWLYRFMPNLKFVDYVPTDDDLEKIRKIDELVNNG